MTRILVTGATGNVGRTVTSLLARQPAVRVRALARDAGASARSSRGSELAVGDFTDPDSLDAALDGSTPSSSPARTSPARSTTSHLLIDRAAAAGVRRLVKLSGPGRGDRLLGRVLALARPDRAHLDASGIPAVVLRPSFLMSNLLAAAEPVRDHGLVFAPADHARISMVDPRDVAAVAPRSCRPATRGHDGRTYVVTGPSAISYDVVAAALADVLGRDVAYLDVSPDEARRAMLDQGLPPFVVDQLGAVFTALRRGDQQTTTDACGRSPVASPRSFAEFAATTRRLHRGARDSRGALRVRRRGGGHGGRRPAGRSTRARGTAWAAARPASPTGRPRGSRPRGDPSRSGGWPGWTARGPASGPGRSRRTRPPRGRRDGQPELLDGLVHAHGDPVVQRDDGRRALRGRVPEPAQHRGHGRRSATTGRTGGRAACSPSAASDCWIPSRRCRPGYTVVGTSPTSRMPPRCPAARSSAAARVPPQVVGGDRRDGAPTVDAVEHHGGLAAQVRGQDGDAHRHGRVEESADAAVHELTALRHLQPAQALGLGHQQRVPPLGGRGHATADQLSGERLRPDGVGDEPDRRRPHRQRRARPGCRGT